MDNEHWGLSGDLGFQADSSLAENCPIKQEAGGADSCRHGAKELLWLGGVWTDFRFPDPKPSAKRPAPTHQLLGQSFLSLGLPLCIGRSLKALAGLLVQYLGLAEPSELNAKGLE